MWGLPEEILKHRDDDTALNWAVSQMKDPEEFLKSVANAYEYSDLQLHDEIHLKDGRTFDRHGASIRNAQGDNYGWVWSFRDITGHKQAEQELSDAKSHLERRVRERTAQLEAVNKGLEAFAYSISHDLRSPIRTIGSFAELLSEEQAGRFDAEGAMMLNAIKQSAKNMDGMVTGMLELARLGQQPMAKSKVDMNHLAREVVREMLPQKAKRKAAVNIHPLPAAYGNETALRLVIENLFSNALKYTRDRPEPIIEVGARDEDEEQIYYVKDNGAGFDMRQKEKLFVPFQRLHGGEFEGTGIGLATVSRIISHSGGRVWAEGEVDKGATFFFSLPGQPE
jgi:light-regulated signal transduction histidine kinase (bacteriophytochrome)